MTRRYDVRTGMMEHDTDAGQPREQLVPGWRVPGHSRYDYDLRIGDAERDTAMAQLRDHFVAGRLTFDELTERLDLALTAKTQRQIDGLMADLPRPPRPVRTEAAPPVHDQDAGRFLVFALLLFAMATWILILAWMSRHAYVYGGPFQGGPFQGGPGGPMKPFP
jgi:Domain of unknown function (DUF1707)